MTDSPHSAAPAAPPKPELSSSIYTSRVTTRLSSVFLVLLGVLVVVLIAAPMVLERPMLQDLIFAFLLIALAQCWNLLAGYAGLISVGQQAFVGLGGYAVFAGIVIAGLDPILAIPVSAVLVTALSIPVAYVVFRLQGAYFAVVTWVVAEVFRLLLAQWKTLGGGTGMSLPRKATSDMIGLDWVADLFGVRAAAAREILIYWAALGTVVVVVAVAYWLLRSRVGLALRAIRDGEVAAQSVGVSTSRTKLAVYAFAAFGASLAGAVYFLQASRISPDAAFSLLDWTAYIIFIVVIGGIGTIEGPFVGAILFVLLQNWLDDFGAWYLIILGALGIVIMLVAPQGLWGTFSQKTGIHLFPIRRIMVRKSGNTPARQKETDDA